MSRRKASSIHKVFISHSHHDRHFAVDLQSVLEENRVDTFLDQDRIEPLDNLPAEVEEGISWCDSLLLLWSSSAASSLWVQREWDAAYEKRKKIIPYVLDHTPLPPALENLVYIDSSDQQHGNAQLLKAVFGRDFQPEDPSTLFPGSWKASMDAFGMIQATYDLELRENGQVEGEGGASNTGMAGQIASQMGMGGVLSMRIPFHGSWSYDQGSQTLTIETATNTVFGQQQNDTIRIRATGHEKGKISGQDLGGRQWALWRVGEKARSQTRSRADEMERQKIRDEFQTVLNSAREGVTRDNLVLVQVLAIYCMGVQEKYREKYGVELGLPTEKAIKVLQSEGDAKQSAAKDFMRAMEKGGWIK